VTGRTTKAGLPVIGLIFLVLAAFKMGQGEPWVVWAILGFLFGGFGIFKINQSGGTRT